MKVTLLGKTGRIISVEVEHEKGGYWFGVEEGAIYKEPLPYMKSLFELIDDKPE